MNYRRDAARTIIALSALVALGCTDSPAPSEPNGMSPSFERSARAQDRLAALFTGASAEVLAMPGTVWADYDEARGKLVFGVHNMNAVRGIERSLEARGIATEDFEITAAEPIYQLANLQTSAFRPTQAGTQIHFGNYVCTLGFNVDIAGTRSFITNSHCTNTQGGVEGTTYAQPVRNTAADLIATEVADPAYSSSLSGCSANKVCRRSDASRAQYNAGVVSARGVIAKTTGVNNKSLTTSGTFHITSQNTADDNFSGTVDKVGRTTGWTRGDVTQTCATVNVSQSNIQLLCQTMVYNRRAAIVSGGDSGSPVFKNNGTDDVELIGILWGGSGTSTFVFSPLKNVVSEIGSFAATYDGSGGEPEDPTDPPCVPKGKGNNCK